MIRNVFNSTLKEAHTESPESSEPIRITGLAGDFVSVRLVYVVDRHRDEAEASINDGPVTAPPSTGRGPWCDFVLQENPPMSEGERPIAGDAARYGGTIVQSPATTVSTGLPILRLFMPDEINKETVS